MEMKKVEKCSGTSKGTANEKKITTKYDTTEEKKKRVQAHNSITLRVLTISCAFSCHHSVNALFTSSTKLIKSVSMPGKKTKQQPKSIKVTENEIDVLRC